MSESEPPRWNAAKSAELYGVNGWGAPYFSVNEAGNIRVSAGPGSKASVDLYDLTREVRARGVELPLLVRFWDILCDRIAHLNRAFARAIREWDYPGRYRGVFPVKVNQQRHLVEQVVEAGREFSYGLEAGSKPELLIALAAMRGDGLIICNGYKDTKYIETALIAQRCGHTVIIVLERLDELDTVLEASDRLGIAPVLGVRAKLSAKGIGRWASSSGDRAKFGLNTIEIIEVVDRLSERDMLGALQLLHFHAGSQISSIIPLKNALAEAANVYVELAKLGCKMGYFDVGGGLAIDYDGSKSDFHASRNYTLEEYAGDVVTSIQDACEKAGIDAPTLVSESGRAITAHQSVLIFQVVGTNELRVEEPSEPTEADHRIIQELYDTWANVKPKNVQESYHDAQQAKEEARSLFKYGYLSLKERARAERLHWHVLERIQQVLRRLKFVPEELQDLDRDMSTIYYCNFSVFQSAPDTWAIDALLPILPIHRLGEEPTVPATLADLTCDSDGIIDNFIDRDDVAKTLNLHPLNGEPYYIAMFLGGAYQEILGDLHNLFGDTNAVNVRLAEDGYNIENVIKGDSVTEVLRYVAYSPSLMVEQVRHKAESAVKAGQITVDQMRTLLEHYEAALAGYTYLTA